MQTGQLAVLFGFLMRNMYTDIGYMQTVMMKHVFGKRNAVLLAVAFTYKFCSTMCEFNIKFFRLRLADVEGSAATML